MSLEDDIAEWMAERHDWQKATVARFCRNEALTDEDVASIAEHLVAGTYPVTAALSASDIPGTSESGEAVALLAVTDIEGVNALLPDQRLAFGDRG